MARSGVALAALAGLLCLLGCAAAAAGFSASGATFYEKFDAAWTDRWVYSSDDKYKGAFELTSEGIKVPEKNLYYGVTAALPAPVDVAAGLTVQYEVKFTEDVTCGGAYLKLISEAAGFEPAGLVDTTPYSIMFGPDKCGSAKTHLILRHASPVTGEVTEHHLKSPPFPETDSKSHVYTLTIRPDATFSLLVDGDERSSGSLLEQLEPPINPPKDIPDPSDVKPADWVDEAEIADPSDSQPSDWDEREMVEDADATKPAGWLDDEPEFTTDPDAVKPSDWNDEEDGEWEAPTVPNPACAAAGCGEWRRPQVSNPDYKGPWTAKMVPNPAYKGEWAQKTIPNPGYFEDAEPLKRVARIAAVAIEIWTVDTGYQFSNLLITADAEQAAALREAAWRPKFDAEAKVAAAEQEARMAGMGAKPFPADLIFKFFDLPALERIRPYVQSALEPLEQYPKLAYVYLAIPLVLVLSQLLSLLSGLRPGRKAPAAAADAGGAADAPKTPKAGKAAAAEAPAAAAAAAEPPSPTAAKTPKAARSTGRAAKAPSAEIEEEEAEDDGDGDKPKRRAARRKA